MPSDSIAGFLDEAKAKRVLFPDQVEQLIRHPDAPQSDLSALCAYLLERSVLTRFQADAILERRANDLIFGSYPIVDEIGPCPGGTAYRALHPSLRTPVVLRKFRGDAFAPYESATDVVSRARAYGMLAHPNLLSILDAGEYQGTAYVVLDHPTDAASLDVLLREVGGAMPGFLAAEYGWAAASALHAIHERGGRHGEVRPGLLIVGPLTVRANPDGSTRRKPAPNATVRLAETGITPLRGPASANLPSADVLAYRPPEQLDGAQPDSRGDIYGLGASLYQLLTGRPPHTAEAPQELLNKVRSASPAPLSALRPDVPAGLAALVMRMLSKRPEERPQTAAEVQAGLAPFCRPGVLPAVPQSAVPMAAPMSVVLTAQLQPSAPPQVTAHAVPVAVPVAPPEPDGWGVSPNAFANAQAESAADTKQPRRRQMTDKEKSRSKIWIVVGLCLHMSAVGLIVAWLMGVFNPSPDPVPPSKGPPKVNPGQKVNRPKAG